MAAGHPLECIGTTHSRPACARPSGMDDARCCQGSEGAGGALPLVHHRWGCHHLFSMSQRKEGIFAWTGMPAAEARSARDGARHADAKPRRKGAAQVRTLPAREGNGAHPLRTSPSPAHLGFLPRRVAEELVSPSGWRKAACRPPWTEPAPRVRTAPAREENAAYPLRTGRFHVQYDGTMPVTAVSSPIAPVVKQQAPVRPTAQASYLPRSGKARARLSEPGRIARFGSPI